MRIRWIGKYNGKNLPAAELPPGARRVMEPDGGALPALLVLLAVAFGLLSVKKYLLDGTILLRGPMTLGFGLALLLVPLHELLHAAAFPAGAEVDIFYTRFGLGTSCTAPVSRGRFLLIALLPSTVLGLVPLAALLLVPGEACRWISFLFGVGALHLAGGNSDYVTALHLLRLPPDATVQISEGEIYWYRR